MKTPHQKNIVMKMKERYTKWELDQEELTNHMIKEKGKRVECPKERKVKFRETNEPMEEDEEIEEEQTVYVAKDKDKINKKRMEALQRAREKARQKNICNRCGIQGHWGTECPRLQCTRCGKKGHEWNKCLEYPLQTKPRKRKEIIIDESMKEKYEFMKYILKNLPRVSFEENLKHNYTKISREVI